MNEQITIPGIFEALVDEAFDIYRQGVALATEGGRTLTASVVLFSGGNDSTTVAHLFRNVATHAGHCNTGIGIEATREYVRRTCAAWGLPLIEKHPKPERTYRKLVLGEAFANARDGSGRRALWKGFPGAQGPAHNVMFNKLKQDGMDAIRRDLVRDPRRERMIFIGGIRRAESKRRRHRGCVERQGSAVYVSPLINWTRLDMNECRRRNPDVPRNEVSDLIHMSGECLCGSFARPGELDEIEAWYPDVVAEIRGLEAEAARRGIERCRWGGGNGSPCAGICNL